MTNRVGQQFGNYQLQRLIGTGAFAEVYLAEHKYLRTHAAIKILHARLANEDQEYFLDEARTVAHLLHRHIIRVLEFGIENTTPFLVMDYAPHGTLRQLHPKGTRVPLATIVSYVKQVAEALDYAHSQNVIHRDIKPENMLLGSKNDVLLSDFGIAQVAQSSRLQHVSTMAGTMGYMAPEQISIRPHIASDQYALGIVVYEWLTGERPFQGQLNEIAIKHKFMSPPSFYERVPGMNRAVEDVVMIALAKEPQQRFATVTAFARALEQASLSAVEKPSAQQEPIADTYVTTPMQSPSMQLANPVIPALFEDTETSASEPSTLGKPREAKLQETTRLAVPNAIPVQRVVPTPSTRKGFPRGRVVYGLVLLLLILSGSTGIFTIFAHRSTTTSKAPVLAPKPSVVARTSPTSITPIDATIAQDTFQRADQSLWGTASDGQQWQEDANRNPFFSIRNGTGQLVATANTGPFNALLGPLRNNEDILFTASINQFGKDADMGAVVRFTDAKNWYKAFITGKTLAFAKSTHGVVMTITSTPFIAHDGVFYSLHFRIVGTRLYANVWQSNQQEPKTWMLIKDDNSFTTIHGRGGMRLSAHSGTVVIVRSFCAGKVHSIS